MGAAATAGRTAAAATRLALATRLAAAVTVIAALAWAASTAIGLLRADTLAFEASREMANWNAARIDPAVQTWSVVSGELLRAAALEPANPAIHELLGILGSRRVDAPEHLRDAAVHFREALKLRPVSAYTWANLAEAKYRLGETDPEFETALWQAAELGPAEPAVQRSVAFYGLAVWDEVAPGTRAAVDRMVGAGFRRNPLEMLQIAERRGRLAVPCRHLAASPRRPDEKWSQICQSTEAT